MIDLHCHVLPELDDGARDLEDSLGMARQAEADGIELICATPHIRHDHDVLVHELPARVEALNEALARHGVGVRVRTGAEVAEAEAQALADLDLRAVSLCGTGRWLLLEPAPGPLSDSLTETVEHLRERGTRSLIAHPERHMGENAAGRLRDLVDRGALVQATAAYLDNPAVIELAGKGLVHVLGSDAHSSRAGRPVALAAAFERLGELPPAGDHLAWIRDTAPAAIVAGEDVEPPY